MHQVKIEMVKVAGVANASVDFLFFPSQHGNIKLNIDTINNHPALMSYFTNPSLKKKVLLEIPTF